MTTSERQLPVRAANVARGVLGARRVVLELELGALLQRFDQAGLRPFGRSWSAMSTAR